MSVLRVDAAGWRGGDHYASRAHQLRVAAGATAMAIGVVCAVVLVATEEKILLLAVLGGALAGLVILMRPVIGVYILFAGAVLFEQAGITGLTPITEQVRFFKGFDSFTSVPLHASLADVLLLLSAVSLVVSHVAGRHTFRMGAFGWAVAGYGAAFVVGIAIGVARGSSWSADAAITELRAPLHMCVTYFLAASLIRQRKQLALLMWVFALLVGVKAVQGILNYQESLSLPYALEAVTGHEDVVFFDLAIVLSLMMLALGVRTRFAYTLLALQPLILSAEILTQRRVGFAALGAVLLVMAVLFIAGNPRRGLLLAALGALAIGAYAAVFWERDEGPLGQPIRTLRSALDPMSVSARDLRSGNWREIENRNIEFTVSALPLTGVGVGARYLQHEQPPSMTYVFEYWRYITHNALLWLWLKAGPLGGFALWFLVARVLLLGSAMYVRIREPRQRVLVLVPIALIAIQVAFSSVDMGLTHARTMIVLGTVLGASAFLFAPIVSARPLSAARVRST